MEELETSDTDSANGRFGNYKYIYSIIVQTDEIGTSGVSMSYEVCIPAGH